MEKDYGTVKEDGKRYGPSRTRITLTLLLTLAALLLASCGEEADRDPGSQDDIGEPTPEQQAPAATGPRDSVTLEELTRRPERFYGEQVIVNGRVGQTISPNAFSLTSADAADSDEAFEVEAALVAGDEGSIPDLSEGQRVRVTGEVQRFNLEEVEQELGVNLDDDRYADFEEKPMILPETVEVLAGGETMER